MNPRVRKRLEHLELAADGVYSAAIPQSSQQEEIVLRETVAARKHCDHLRVISQHHSIEVMDAEVRRFLAGIPPDGVIVDVGRGWGWHWRRLRELRSKVHVVIVDLARSNFIHAHQILGDMVNDQVFLVQADATSLPFEGNGLWATSLIVRQTNITQYAVSVCSSWTPQQTMAGTIKLVTKMSQC